MSRRDKSFDAPLRTSAWGRPGGDWAGMRPTIDNPFTWSLPLLKVAGITVRVHVLFLIFIIVQLSRALAPAKGQHVDFALTALAMGVLLVVVLAHEFGHCLACRAVRGEVDEILMWPLGGLAMCHPPRTWRAHLITALGGPLVNVLIIALAAPLLMMITQRWWGLALPNPLDPLASLYDPRISRSWAHITLYMVNAMSLTLLAFNVLPLLPLDGGRIAHALAWPAMGWSAAMRLAVQLGYLVGLGLAVFGAITENWPLIAVAIFGLWSCYASHKQLEFSDSVLGSRDDEFDLTLDEAPVDDDDDDALDSSLPIEEEERAVPSRNTMSQAADAAMIDDILRKIAAQGMASLTADERALLERETQRKRQGG